MMKKNEMFIFVQVILIKYETRDCMFTLVRCPAVFPSLVSRRPSPCTQRYRHHLQHSGSRAGLLVCHIQAYNNG